MKNYEELAKQLGDKHNCDCILQNIRSATEPILWICKKCNNKWLRTYKSARKSNWCVYCLKKEKGQNRLKEAQNMGFNCLSTDTIFWEEAKEWEWIGCKHRFIDMFYNLKLLKECAECKSIKLLVEAKNILQRIGAEIINIEDTGKLFNTVTKIQIKTVNGFICTTDYCTLVRRKNSDKIWNYKVQKYTADMIEAYIKQNAKELTFLEYFQGDDGKYFVKCRCICGNIFVKKFYKLRNGQHCPKHSESKSERIIRCYFEQIFGVKFRKQNPAWLKNPITNYTMQLDGYNEDLKIAFEHNGNQHYELVSKFGMTQEDLNELQKRDAIKIELCKNNGIKLIVIPELFRNVGLSDLKNYIKQECVKQGIVLPYNFDDIDVDISSAMIPSDNEIFEELDEIVEKYGVGNKIITREYVSCSFPLECECECGYKWKTTAMRIKSGYWCPDCGGTRKWTIEEVFEEAIKHNCKCLSNKYVNYTTEMNWQCLRCHNIWCADYHKMMRRDNWCLYCSGRIK